MPAYNLSNKLTAVRDISYLVKESNYKIAFIFGPTKKEYRKASQKDDNYLIPRLNVSYGMEPKKLLFRLMIPF